MCEILNQQIERYTLNAEAKWKAISQSLEILKGMEARIRLVKKMRKTLSFSKISTYLVDREIRTLKEKISYTLENIQLTRKSRKNDFIMIKHLENAKFIVDSSEINI